MLIFNYLENFIPNSTNCFLGSCAFLRSFKVDIPVVSDVEISYTNAELRVCEWTNFREESAQAAGSIVLSSFAIGSLAGVIIGGADDNDISMFSLFDESIESRIVINHVLIINISRLFCF